MEQIFEKIFRSLQKCLTITYGCHFLQIVRCPKCKYSETKVSDTRISQNGQLIKRRRICLACGYRFQTNETIFVNYPVVVKRDGSEVDFSKPKLQASIEKALSKDNLKQLNDICENIISEIMLNFTEQITSKEIGEVVMQILKNIDAPAYMRFASVYKEFKSADDFGSEIIFIRSTVA